MGALFKALAFSPDGSWLATGSMSGNLTIWDPRTGERVWDEGHHEGYVYKVEFGGDGLTLVSGGADGVSYVWNLGQPITPEQANPDRLWRDLAGEDSAQRFKPVASCVASPKSRCRCSAKNFGP